MTSEQRDGAAGSGHETSVLGKYRLIAKLGHGGMADVYLAVARGLASFNKLVVIKRHRAPETELDDEDSPLEMFLDEAKLSARLNHPNIVQTYEIGEENSAYFIVMEYLDGQPLNRVIKAVGRGEPGTARFKRGVWLRIIAEVLSGLHAAHELCDYDGSPLGIVHRDISPHNIFVTYDGAVKVVDFGIAKAAVNSSKTQAGVLKGKTAYMAPEQALASTALDRRADIFVVGIVLWELLSQKRLFAGDAANAIRKLVTEEVPRLSTVVPDIPPELDELVAKSLGRDPESRYSTALEMRAALDAYLRSSGEDVRLDEIGAAMVGVYEARRALMRQQIKSYLERPASDDGADNTRSRLQLVTGTGVSLAALPRLEESGRSSTVTPPATGVGSSSVSLPLVVVPTSKRRHVLTGVAAAVVATAAIFLLRRPATPAPPPAAPVATTAERTDGVGVLSIVSDPPEAMLTWNGRALGKTPLKVDLPPGSQSLVVSRPDFFDETLVLLVTAGSTIERSVTLRPRATASAAPSSEKLDPRRRFIASTREPVRPATPAPSATEAPPQPATAPAGPKVQILSDGDKPRVKVDILQ